MAKRFELTITARFNLNGFECDSFDKLESDDLVQLLSQFILVIGSLHRKLVNEAKNSISVESDDILF